MSGEGHQIPVEYIGPRIMVQLRARAAQLVRHLNNDDVNKVDGMSRIFAVLERSPLVKQLDKHRVDQHRKRLMSLNRVAGESLESYITRGNIYRNQLLGLDSSLEMGEKFYIGHLLDHARLTRRDKALVRTRAGEETEESVTNAMIELAAELEGEHGCPIGASEPNVAGANGEEFLVQRPERNFTGGGGKKFFGKAALGVAMMSQVGDEECDGAFGDDQSEDGFDEDVPMEIVEAEKEAYAMHYKAKQRMAEVKKLRKYYKQGETAEERKRAIAEKMKVTACHNCGEVGHWSRECPKGKPMQQAYLAGSTLSRRRKKTSSVMGTIEESAKEEEEREWSLLMSLCSQNPQGASKQSAGVYMVLPREYGASSEGMAPHEVLWCVEELKGSDLGCLKSVAGTKWMNQVIKRWQENDRWFKVVRERETFRFGNGETLPSKYGVLLQATFAGHDVILNFSVVQGDCPPLLSRPACTQLGAIFDCSQHMLSSRRLGVKQYGLTQTQSGHYTMCIEEFGENSLQVSLPHDFAWKAGNEVYIWQHEQPVLALQSFGSDHRDRDCGVDAHGVDACPTLSSMRRSRPSDKGMSINSVRRRSTSAHVGRHRHGWDQRGQFAEEVEANGGEGHDSGSQGVSPPTRGGVSSAWMEVPETRAPEEYRMDAGSELYLTEKEKETIMKKREKASRSEAKRNETKALTGMRADYPSLSHEWSAEVPFNVVGSVMEEEQEVAGDALREGGGRDVGPFWSDEAEAARPDRGGLDVEGEPEQESPEGYDSPGPVGSSRTATEEELGSDGLPLETSGDESEMEIHERLADVLEAEAGRAEVEDKWERPVWGGV